jgi:hypothetical protein
MMPVETGWLEVVIPEASMERHGFSHNHDRFGLLGSLPGNCHAASDFSFGGS